MDALTGAFIAAAVGWASIFLVAYGPRLRLPIPAVRAVGAATIGLLALLVLGAPVSPSWPLVFLAGGLYGAWQAHRVRAGEPRSEGATAEAAS